MTARIWFFLLVMTGTLFYCHYICIMYMYIGEHECISLYMNFIFEIFRPGHDPLIFAGHDPYISRVIYSQNNFTHFWEIG